MYSYDWPAMSEPSESIEASGTIELATAFLSGFRNLPAKVAQIFVAAANAFADQKWCVVLLFILDQ